MTEPHRIGAATRVFALLGDPVAHSRSPAFQNAALRHLGLDGVYVTLRCAAEDAPALVRALARAGGGGNVTVPHKTTVLSALERTTAAVDRTGACNTFWLEAGRVCGDNTDVTGLREALSQLGGDFADARVLLLGAGGAAGAAAVALLDAGAARIDVLNRTTERAARLCRRLDAARMQVLQETTRADTAYDLVVNATTVGLHDDTVPVDERLLARAGAVLDLIVRPRGTALVRRAAALGIRAADGTAMLLGQGAAAFRLWWHREPPREVMRAAIEDG